MTFIVSTYFLFRLTGRSNANRMNKQKRSSEKMLWQVKKIGTQKKGEKMQHLIQIIEGGNSYKNLENLPAMSSSSCHTAYILHCHVQNTPIVGKKRTSNDLFCCSRRAEKLLMHLITLVSRKFWKPAYVELLLTPVVRALWLLLLSSL